jgi:UDP-N-acetylmuramoyl-tripeptide--D-alanyl-D-alanine ligase
VDAVFACGDLTRHTIHAMNGAAMFHQFYDDKASLLTDLKEFLMTGDIIYIKGSRSMRMEEIITGLQS